MKRRGRLHSERLGGRNDLPQPYSRNDLPRLVRLRDHRIDGRKSDESDGRC